MTMSADQIPLPSKIMTVCDIFDALTASDKPYKPAMGLDKALDILRMESKQGYLDSDLVQIFIDAKVYKCIESKVYSSANSATGTSNHPCAHDLHEHD
jgi:HD-GYP domain-containing protein (c-di-GMP phosphodiesterase class II)